jgi:hypothetical protein
MRAALRGTLLVLMGAAGWLTLALPAVAHACAVCVGASAEDQGYFWGVLFLMATPFLLAGSIGGWIVYHHRRPPQAALLTRAGRDLD